MKKWYGMPRDPFEATPKIATPVLPLKIGKDANMKVQRLVAAYIDNMVVSILCAPLLLLRIRHPAPWTLFCLALVYLTLFVLKDVPAPSIGKRLLKLDIYKYGTSVKASIGQRICRNILLLVWPVELIALLLSPNERRLSDRLCGTGVKRRTDP